MKDARRYWKANGLVVDVWRRAGDRRAQCSGRCFTVVMMQVEKVVTMALTVARDMSDAAILTRFAITLPAPVRKLSITAGNMRQNGCVRLNCRHAHP